jgi:hypothetical protein
MRAQSSCSCSELRRRSATKRSTSRGQVEHSLVAQSQAHYALELSSSHHPHTPGGSVGQQLCSPVFSRIPASVSSSRSLATSDITEQTLLARGLCFRFDFEARSQQSPFRVQKRTKGPAPAPMQCFLSHTSRLSCTTRHHSGSPLHGTTSPQCNGARAAFESRDTE